MYMYTSLHGARPHPTAHNTGPRTYVSGPTLGSRLAVRVLNDLPPHPNSPVVGGALQLGEHSRRGRAPDQVGTRGSSTIRVGATEVQRPPDGLSTVRGHESTHVTEGGVDGLT